VAAVVANLNTRVWKDIPKAAGSLAPFRIALYGEACPGIENDGIICFNSRFFLLGGN
jgi:hypothetical protein